MSSSLRIDWCTSHRVGEVQGFIDGHWKKGHVLTRDARLLRWQFPGGGDSARLSVLLAEDEAGVQGILGAIPVGFNDYGKRHRGVMLANWFASEAGRAKGVGLRLLQRMLDEHPFVGVLGVNAKT